MGSTDGMCPWKDKKLISAWPFVLAILNLPFYLRWQLANVILTSVSHNSVLGQPCNFNTHHRLIAEDLLVGWELGFSIVVAGVAVTVRVMMAFLIGDGPGCDLCVRRHVHVDDCAGLAHSLNRAGAAAHAGCMYCDHPGERCAASSADACASVVVCSALPRPNTCDKQRPGNEQSYLDWTSTSPTAWRPRPHPPIFWRSRAPPCTTASHAREHGAACPGVRGSSRCFNSESGSPLQAAWAGSAGSVHQTAHVLHDHPSRRLDAFGLISLTPNSLMRIAWT